AVGLAEVLAAVGAASSGSRAGLHGWGLRGWLRVDTTPAWRPTGARRREEFLSLSKNFARYQRATTSLAASVDHTDARNDVLGCFGRSDRSAQRTGVKRETAHRKPVRRAVHPSSRGARTPLELLIAGIRVWQSWSAV